MGVIQVSVQRPQRWDTPFAPEMTEADVARLLAVAPFSQMQESAFTKSTPLRGILKNDCRMGVYEPGDILIRQGDYGNSAFLILEGSALVSLSGLPEEILGRKPVSKKSWLESLALGWKNSRFAESRSAPASQPGSTGQRKHGDQTRIFIQDIPGVLDPDDTLRMTAGQLFGELAALTRTPRSATVLADTRCVVLEMRWQGFRDLLKRDPALRKHVDDLYRLHSLRGHLEQIPVLAGLPDDTLDKLVVATRFSTLGNFEWTHTFKKLDRDDVARRIDAEPVIAGQGAPAEEFILIRNGFARVSRKYGDGEQTIAYLGKGQTFGLREIAHNWRSPRQHGYLLTLRAVGYVDLLRIPAKVVQELVLPHLSEDQLPPPLPEPSTQDTAAVPKKPERRLARREPEIETGLLEFLVEHRFINGTQAMLIDLDRCTRCDDCVRACAATHDNNPRFLRQGPQHENWMVAGACMHCVDPVCMIGCPTGAIGRDQVTGHVVIHDQTCIGCGVCSASCPYQNIRLVEIRDGKGRPLVDSETGRPIQKATKCDFCIEQQGGPACQRACPHDALTRVDLTTPQTLYQLTQQ